MERSWQRAFPPSPQTASHRDYSLKEDFIRTATLVTRLYSNPEHQKFVQCANSLTQMHRGAQVEIERAHNRGAHTALRECLDWVVRQGPTIDANLLAQLLKHQMANFAHAERSAMPEEAGANPCTFQQEENHLSASSGGEVLAGDHVHAERRPDLNSMHAYAQEGLDGIACDGSAATAAGQAEAGWNFSDGAGLQAAAPSPRHSRKRRSMESMLGFGYKQEDAVCGGCGPESNGMVVSPHAKVARKALGSAIQHM